jgi:hypothetical protein
MLILIATATIVVIVAYVGAFRVSPVVPLIFLVGQIGGYVGLQSRLRTLSEPDLKLLTTSWVYTILTPMVGGILAILLHMIFLSGLISGQMFPKFVPDANPPDVEDLRVIFATHADGYASYAKLFVWSFVAGYSERFVVDMLGSFAKIDTKIGHDA